MKTFNIKIWALAAISLVLTGTSCTSDLDKEPISPKIDTAYSSVLLQQQDGSYRVLCSTNIDKMFDYFDVEEEIDATTVNGWVVLQLDKLPSVGDHFIYEADYKRFDVTVTKADPRKALEINMIVTELEEDQ